MLDVSLCCRSFRSKLPDCHCSMSRPMDDCVLTRMLTASEFNQVSWSMLSLVLLLSWRQWVFETSLAGRHFLLLWPGFASQCSMANQWKNSCIWILMKWLEILISLGVSACPQHRWWMLLIVMDSENIPTGRNYLPISRLSQVAWRSSCVSKDCPLPGLAACKAWGQFWMIQKWCFRPLALSQIWQHVIKTQLMLCSFRLQSQLCKTASWR